MTAQSTLAAALLPELQPEDAGKRLFLFAVRQMGAHGLHDAAAANALLMAFGKEFRRPLVLVRALMAEMSAAAQRPIRIAPWCCPRVTGCESALLRAMARARLNPGAAELLLADLLGTRSAGPVLGVAQAVAEAFADLALPFE